MKVRDTISPTSIDYTIMGLLHQKPSSGYAIQKAFKSTLVGNYNSSPGTIYPALKRMQSLGLIQSKDQQDNRKKFFQLSSRGKVFLVAWVLNPISKEDVQKRLDELMLRFMFMDDLISQTEKIIFLQTFRDQLKEFIRELENNYSKDEGMLSLHEKLSIEHTISSYKTSLRWAKKSLNLMRE